MPMMSIYACSRYEYSQLGLWVPSLGAGDVFALPAPICFHMTSPSFRSSVDILVEQGKITTCVGQNNQIFKDLVIFPYSLVIRLEIRRSGDSAEIRGK